MDVDPQDTLRLASRQRSQRAVYSPVQVSMRDVPSAVCRKVQRFLCLDSATCQSNRSHCMLSDARKTCVAGRALAIIALCTRAIARVHTLQCVQCKHALCVHAVQRTKKVHCLGRVHACNADCMHVACMQCMQCICAAYMEPTQLQHMRR